MTIKEKEKINFDVFSDIEKNALRDITGNQPYWGKRTAELSPDFLYWYSEGLDMVYQQIYSVLEIRARIREGKRANHCDYRATTITTRWSA